MSTSPAGDDAPATPARVPVDIAELELRRAVRSDAAAIALAHRDSIRAAGPAFYPPETVDRWAEAVALELYLNAMDGGEVFFIACGKVAGEPLVLGFASDYLIEGRTHGTSVYVRGIAARRGIGSALFGMAEAHAREAGAAAIRVDASLAAVAFYQSRGFVETGRGEVRLPSGHAIPCAFMRKALHASAP